MGRTHKFIRWLYSLAGVDSHLQPEVPPAPDSQPALDRQPRHQDSPDPGRSLSVTVSFHRRGVQLEIASSAPAGHPGVTPAAAEVISEAPSPLSLDSTPFWDALDPTEREALRAVASWQTFAAGAMIMREGDRADHVIVILGGRTRVSVNENGRERLLVERGVGQLVGEGGALRVGERSATVVALDLVWALVAETRDFAAFLTAHPRVLALVERQRYDRGIGESAEHDEGGGGGPADFQTGPTHRQPADSLNGLGDGPEPSLTGQNCTVILTDVVGFGGHHRTDHDRLMIRQALFTMTWAAMRGVPSVRLEDRGDGILAVVPPEVSTAEVMDRMVRELHRALEQHNYGVREATRFQLRMAVNVGPVVSDRLGVSGEAIIVAARLVEAPGFKQALADSTSMLGVIASPFVYETVIRHGQNLDYVAAYSSIPVEVKESHTNAWMTLLDAPLPPR